MTNNDILRRLRYSLILNNGQMIKIWKLAGYEADEEKIDSFLKKEDDDGYRNCNNGVMTHFLNGLITYKRGAKKEVEGAIKPAEPAFSNNQILKKLKIALDFSSDNMMEVFDLAEARISKSELGAVFRKEGHKNYKECGDRYIRNFLKGLTLYLKK